MIARDYLWVHGASLLIPEFLMDPLSPHGPFLILAYPYHRLLTLSDPRDLLDGDMAPPGSSLVWDLSKRLRRRDIPVVASRPAGMALQVILPPAANLHEDMPILDVVELCRPQSILPYHPRLDVEELTALLGSPPDDLPAALTDYLQWRGLRIDRDTRQLIRRTVELSTDLKTIAGLARSLFVSRRALGRRFMSRGLPVPSHWLQFSRLLRASLVLQESRDSLFSIACRLGYPDSFSLSNQMVRLVGVRPSLVRERLGWEWIVERWLRSESRAGTLGFPLSRSAAMDRFRPESPSFGLPRLGVPSRPAPARGDSGRLPLQAGSP